MEYHLANDIGAVRVTETVTPPAVSLANLPLSPVRSFGWREGHTAAARDPIAQGESRRLIGLERQASEATSERGRRYTDCDESLLEWTRLQPDPICSAYTQLCTLQ